MFKDRFDEKGKLIPIKGKRKIPVGMKEPLSFEQRVARILRDSNFSREVEARGYETFEEADDFDVGEDLLPTTPYEADFDLAIANAAARGVVRAPSEDQLTKIRDVMRKVAKVKFKRRRDSRFEAEQPSLPAPTQPPQA